MSINKNFQELPPYLNVIYGHIYNDQKRCQKEDSLFLSNLRTFFQYRTLINALNVEIPTRSSVLQFGISFGNQIQETAYTIGSLSKYDILDACQSEINRAKKKYSRLHVNITFCNQDVRDASKSTLYDAVVCYMLLSQVPSKSKIEIVNNALNLVKKRGKVIFIDWHNPSPYHPLRYMVKMYNRLHNPFVEHLWDNDISSYAEAGLRSQFSWRKSTYFGRMFQKCVATRKDDPLTLLELENNYNDNFFA